MAAIFSKTSDLILKVAGAVIGLGAVSGIAAFAYFKVNAGNAAPDVTFTKLDGQQVALKDLRGKVVMIYSG